MPDPLWETSRSARSRTACLGDELRDDGVRRHGSELLGTEPAARRGDHDAVEGLQCAEPDPEVGGLGVLDRAEGEVGNARVGCERLGHPAGDLPGLARARSQRRRGRPGRWAVVGLQRRGADVQGVLGRGVRPEVRLADRGTRRADELGVEGEHRPDAVHDPRHVEPPGQQGPGRLQHLVDDEVGPPLLGHRHQIGEAGERRRAEQGHHPVHHLLFLGQGRIRPDGLVGRPRLRPGRTDGEDLSPRPVSGAQVRAGGDAHVVTGQFGRPDQGQHRQHVPVRRARREQHARHASMFHEAPSGPPREHAGGRTSRAGRDCSPMASERPDGTVGGCAGCC